MKKLIFAAVVVLVSVIALSSCSEDSVLEDLNKVENNEGYSDDGPIIE